MYTSGAGGCCVVQTRAMVQREKAAEARVEGSRETGRAAWGLRPWFPQSGLLCASGSKILPVLELLGPSYVSLLLLAGVIK